MPPKNPEDLGPGFMFEGKWHASNPDIWGPPGQTRKTQAQVEAERDSEEDDRQIEEARRISRRPSRRPRKGNDLCHGSLDDYETLMIEGEIKGFTWADARTLGKELLERRLKGSRHLEGTKDVRTMGWKYMEALVGRMKVIWESHCSTTEQTTKDSEAFSRSMMRYARTLWEKYDMPDVDVKGKEPLKKKSVGKEKDSLDDDDDDDDYPVVVDSSSAGPSKPAGLKRKR